MGSENKKMYKFYAKYTWEQKIKKYRKVKLNTNMGSEKINKKCANVELNTTLGSKILKNVLMKLRLLYIHFYFPFSKFNFLESVHLKFIKCFLFIVTRLICFMTFLYYLYFSDNQLMASGTL